MSFLKKVQNNVAHTSKLPALGNQDRRNLQDVINTEKSFIASNSKSSADFKKNSEAVKTWCTEEGDDLNDVVGKVTLLMDHYSASQNRLNSHLSNVRLHFKSIRTREESFADLKARKRSLGSDIEKVERKLAKMGPENKELMKVTSQLKDMRSEMEALRIDVMNEEAAIGDFKRRTIKEALGIKAGALLELAEKLTVVSEVSKLMLDEISLYPTNPGMPRAEYLSYAKTEALLHEATRSIADVAFTPAGPSVGVPRFADNADTTRDMSHQYGADTDAYYDVPSHANESQLDNGYNLADNNHGRHNDDGEDGDDVGHTPIYAAHASRSQPANFDHVPDRSTDEWAEASRADDDNAHSRNTHGGGGPPVAASAAAAAALAATAGTDFNQVPGHQASPNLPNDGFLMQSNTASAQQSSSQRNSADYQSAQGGHSGPQVGAIYTAPDMTNVASTQSHASDAYDGYTSSNVPHTTTERSAAAGMLGAPLLPPLRTGTPLQNVSSPSSAAHTAPQATDDSAYFQSIGSTRAMQEAMRNPTSPQSATNRQSSYGALAPGTDGGKKVTAAAFRRGFNRNPSNQGGMGGVSSPAPGQSYEYNHNSSNPLPVPPVSASTPQPPGGYTNASTPDSDPYSSQHGGQVQPLQINKRNSNPHAALGAAAAAGTPVNLQGRRYSNENDAPSDLHPYNNPESSMDSSPAPPYLPNPHAQQQQPHSPYRTPQQQYQQSSRHSSQYADFAAPPPPGYGYA